MFDLSGRAAAAPSRVSVALSAALHLAAGLGVAWLAGAASPPQPRFRPATTPTLVYIPVVPIEIPTITLAELRAPEPVVADEPAPPRPAPEVAPVFENLRAEAPRPVELPVAPPPPPAPPTPLPKPEVTVGAFEAVKPAAPVPQPAQQIEVAGFDRPSANTVRPQPAETAIANAGFNRTVAAPSNAPDARVVRDSGFGNTTSREKPRVAEPPAQVASAGFDRVVAPQTAALTAAAPPPPRVVPVEVLFKPTPIYTEEARKLRIEGDVILEVEFLSVGRLRIIRVVRGLGHGLDEAAIQAAEQIRFKPAHDSGRPVDSRARVNIVFRLA